MAVVALDAHLTVSTPGPLSMQVPQIIHINDILITVTTEAFRTVTLILSIRPNNHGTLCYKADTGAGRNVKTLHVFQKLFHSWIHTQGHQTGLHLTVTRLTGYNDMTIPQLEAYGSLAEGTPNGQQSLIYHTHTWFNFLIPPVLPYWSFPVVLGTRLSRWTVPLISCARSCPK